MGSQPSSPLAAVVDRPDGSPTAVLDRSAAVAGVSTGADAATAPRLDRGTALVVALLVAIPLAWTTSLWAAAGGAQDWNQSVTFAPLDLVLAAIGLSTLRRARLGRPHGYLPVAGTVFAGLFVVALAAHPSPLGVALGLRLGAALAVAHLVVRTGGAAATRRVVLASATGLGVVQAGLALVQAHLGHALGVAPLDYAGPLYPFGSSFAGRGGLPHPYHLAVLLVVTQGATLLALRGGRRRWPWCVALGVQAMGVAVTYSRAALLGEIVVVALALTARRENRRLLAPAALAIVVGLAVGALSFGDGWVSRSSQTTSAQQADSGRRDRLREAARLVAREPIVGVGPGRYVVALRDVPHLDLLPAHDLVAQEAAEVGIAAGVVAAALLAGFVARVVRRGTWPLLVAVPILPFLVLDAYPYVFTTGLALTGIWLGLVRLAAHPEPAGTASPA
ncbi:MAG: hypothetical protein JWM05_3308 [Acidimicrobiales bacterium]|nr:hypothetical protein [Acidimicrobiales bacterium]